MTMGANHSAHSRNIGNRVLGRSRRCQADHSSAILSWTCNSDTCVFANQKAIAGASHVFSSGWGISNRRGLPTRRTFDYMLFSFPRNINQSLEKNKWKSLKKTPLPFVIFPQMTFGVKVWKSKNTNILGNFWNVLEQDLPDKLDTLPQEYPH